MHFKAPWGVHYKHLIEKEKAPSLSYKYVCKLCWHPLEGNGCFVSSSIKSRIKSQLAVDIGIIWKVGWRVRRSFHYLIMHCRIHIKLSIYLNFLKKH